MKITNEMAAKIREIAKDLTWDYEKVCVRIQDIPFSLGEMDHVSEVWEDGEQTGEYLDGVSTLSLDYLEHACEYFGDHLAIVCGNEYEYGQDVGEIIIKDATVCEIIA